MVFIHFIFINDLTCIHHMEAHNMNCLTVLSDLYRAHLLSIVFKKMFSVHAGAGASTTKGKTTSPGIWGRRETEMLDFTQAVSL